MVAVDNVITAIAAIFSAISFGTDVPVYVGLPVTESQDSTMILVGSDGDPESGLVIGYNWVWADLAQTRRNERGGIPCSVVCWTGDVEIPATRNRVFSVLELCDSALNNDPTMGGVVLNADLAMGTDEVTQDQNGTKVTASFTVEYWAQV